MQESTIKIFISHPTPHHKKQAKFLELVNEFLSELGLAPMNLGINQWSNKNPMEPIKKMMQQCKGALIIGLGRSHDFIGLFKDSDEYIHQHRSSPWIQIEAGMAYMAGLPMLILKEDIVLKEGILDNISEYSVSEFNLKKCQNGLSEEIKSLILQWSQSIVR
jgi:hypothetical protein